MMQIEAQDGLRSGFQAVPDAATRMQTGLVHAGEHRATPMHNIINHTHGQYEFYFQVEGDSHWLYGERRLTVPAGHLWVVAPGVAHELLDMTRTGHHYCYALIDPEVPLKRLPELDPAWRKVTERTDPVASEEVAAGFRQLINEVSSVRPYATEGLVLAVGHLMLLVCRSLGSKPEYRNLLEGHQEVRAAQQLLQSQLDEPWTLGQLAARVGMAPAYLAQLFTKEVGVSPHRYLTEQRLARAKELLGEPALSVTAIAMELGFSSSQHFARVFRRYSKTSPREFRQLHYRTSQQ